MSVRPLALLFVFAATSAHALYDPAARPELADAEGRWVGQLTYRDYSDDRREVTLPVVANVALAAPDELVFHAIYDDGPKKTVHSYERLKFDTGAKALTWTHGLGADETSRYVIDATSLQAGVREFLVSEQSSGKDGPHCVQYALRWSRTALDIVKREGQRCDATAVRSRSAYRRAP